MENLKFSGVCRAGSSPAFGTKLVSKCMNKLQNLKSDIESILDYWNGDCNEKAMKDALDHYQDEFDRIVDEIDDIDQSSLLDSSWRYCDEYGLPERVGEFGGSGFSENVFVTDGKRYWVDCVMYPHGIYGADTTPKFCKDHDKVIAWMRIPLLQNRSKT